MEVYEDNGPFYTEDGEEVEGLVVIEVALESGALFTVGVSQNLVDLGLINNDWGTFKSIGEYKAQCCREHCAQYTDPYTAARCCRDYCFWWAIGEWLDDLTD